MTNSISETLSQTPEQRQSTQMLLALGRTGKHIYEGTVSGVEKARRRATNKRARAARRLHR